MRSIWTDRRLARFAMVAAFALVSYPAWAQRGGTAGSTGAGSTGTTGRGTTGSIPTNPSTGIGTTTNNTGMGTSNGPFSTRPIFLSGKVMMDDGSAPSSEIRIERVCGGNPRLESHTDSKGRFSFQVGNNMNIDTDAADASTGGMGGGLGNMSGTSRRGGMGGNSDEPLWNCELRAAYPGYRSDMIDLASRRALDDPDVGTIVLHRLGNVQGTTISVTTAMAPKNAQKDYAKGMQAVEKGKFDEAEKRLSEATSLYPKFAVAWFALGQVEQRQNKPEEARKAFEAAIAADSKYVSPYDQLALLSATSGKWDDAVHYSQTAIGLNPVEFPSSFWYNAVANYNLNRPGDAEKSAREVVKMDTRHRYPDAENLLAALLMQKGNYTEAAVHLRAYLALVPNAKNADALKQQLSKMEQASAEPKKPQ